MVSPSFHNAGNWANFVSFGLVSQIAARFNTIDPTRGFLLGSVITIGINAYAAESIASFTVSLAAYCKSATGLTWLCPLTTFAIFCTGADSTGHLSFQYGQRLIDSIRSPSPPA